MSTLKHLLLRPHAALAGLAMAMAALLAGCGPGVGGTGTGDTAAALAYFGASPAPICSSELGALVTCRQDSSTATPVPGTAPVILADADGRVRVRLQEDTIEVVAACAPLDFRGQWGEIAGQAARYYGHTGAAAAPATLEAQAGASGLVLTLRDAAGRVLLGPVAVTPTATPPATPVCP